VGACLVTSNTFVLPSATRLLQRPSSGAGDRLDETTHVSAALEPGSRVLCNVERRSAEEAY